jgi:hypothetical protein
MSTGSPLLGVLAMVAFGLGTAPLMLVFGFASSLLSRGFQAKMQIVAALAVVIFGLVIFNRGLMLVGSPVTYDSARTAVIGGPVVPGSGAGQYAKGADGVVEIPLTIQNGVYSPSTVAIPANTPVRLVVDRKASDACSAQLAIPQAGVLANLAANGVTKVNVPAMRAGSYTLTCGMGMLSGSISAGAGGGGGGGGGGGSPLLLPAILIALIGGGYAVYSYRAAHRPAPVPPAKAAKGAASGTGQRRSGAGSGKGAGSGRTSRAPQRGPAAVPAGVRVFSLWGFEPVELVIGASIVGIASIIGLASGGLFR